MKKNDLIAEDMLLKQLDIPDWRHMTKDKVMAFASAMPYMDPSVAKAAIAQFPQFKDMSACIVATMRDSLNIAADEGGKSTQRAYDLNEKILDGLNRQLDRKFLFPGERQKIIDSMVKVSENIAEIDRTNKNFLLSGLRNVGILGLSATIIGAASLGVKAAIKNL